LRRSLQRSRSPKCSASLAATGRGQTVQGIPIRDRRDGSRRRRRDSGVTNSQTRSHRCRRGKRQRFAGPLCAAGLPQRQRYPQTPHDARKVGSRENLGLQSMSVSDKLLEPASSTKRLASSSLLSGNVFGEGQHDSDIGCLFINFKALGGFRHRSVRLTTEQPRIDTDETRIGLLAYGGKQTAGAGYLCFSGGGQTLNVKPGSLIESADVLRLMQMEKRIGRLRGRRRSVHVLRGVRQLMRPLCHGL
jgi:hypothetical protein